MASRCKRKLSAMHNHGTGRIASIVNHQPPQFVPAVSREEVRVGEELNEAALGQMAAKAYAEELDRRARMLDPLIGAMMRQTARFRQASR